MERCSTSLAIRKIQSKTTMRYHLSECLLSIRQETMRIGEDMKKKKSSYTAGRNVNWYSHYGEQHGGSSKIENIATI